MNVFISDSKSSLQESIATEEKQLVERSRSPSPICPTTEKAKGSKKHAVKATVKALQATTEKKPKRPREIKAKQKKAKEAAVKDSYEAMLTAAAPPCQHCKTLEASVDLLKEQLQDKADAIEAKKAQISQLEQQIEVFLC